MKHPLTLASAPPICLGGTPAGASPGFLSQSFDQTTSSVEASATRAFPAACMVVMSDEITVPSLLNAVEVIGTMNVRPANLPPVDDCSGRPVDDVARPASPHSRVGHR